AGASHPLSAVPALTPAFRDDHALIYRDKLLPCGWRHSFVAEKRLKTSDPAGAGSLIAVTFCGKGD
ncbi:MAG: hypothetical protein ACRDA6_11230, partial [Aeromonas veronii]